MSVPSILFVADGGPEIGGGHVMRSLTLAGSLAARGAHCAFVAPPFVEAVLDRFGDPSIGRIPASGPTPAELVEAAAAAAGCFDAVVFDHFRIAAGDHRRVAGDLPSMAIDDLADRPLGVRLVLDPGPARRPEDYAALLPDGATVLAGPAWALVRPAFAEARGSAMARRAVAPEVGRVLVSLGLTDVGGITARVVHRLLPRLGEATVDLVLGRDAPSLPTLERLAEREPRLVLHVETEAMAGLCAAADLAVGAGGSSLWERCVVGLPGVLVVLADNQVPASSAAARAGAAELVDARAGDFEAALDRAFTGLMRSPDRRARMAARAAALCDGRGADRAAGELLALVRT